MADKKARNPRFVSDSGIAIYPYLVEPDTKFNAEGDYKVKLRLPPNAKVRDPKGKAVSVQEFIDEQLALAVEGAKKEAKGKVKEADAPYEIDEETGEVLVNFKLKATGKTREGKEFTQKPAIFDAKGKPIEPDAIWGGSKMKVSFETIPFYTKLIGAGVSLRLRAVQIIELKAGGQGGGNGGAFGFGEEDGYEAEDAAGSEGFTNTEEADTPSRNTGDEDEGDF